MDRRELLKAAAAFAGFGLAVPEAAPITNETVEDALVLRPSSATVELWGKRTFGEDFEYMQDLPTPCDLSAGYSAKIDAEVARRYRFVQLRMTTNG